MEEVVVEGLVEEVVAEVVEDHLLLSRPVS